MELQFCYSSPIGARYHHEQIMMTIEPVRPNVSSVFMRDAFQLINVQNCIYLKFREDRKECFVPAFKNSSK